jgi:hypothetical protein
VDATDSGAASASTSTLKPDAITFLDALVIGLAATSPAYSLAAVLGPIVALVGVIESVRDIAERANSYTGQAWLGVGPPLVIGVAVLLAGVVLMLFWRWRDTAFWQERASVAAMSAVVDG